jgi:hypothetical protein
VVDSHVNIDPESISRIGASTFNIFSGETPKSKSAAWAWPLASVVEAMRNGFGTYVNESP